MDKDKIFNMNILENYCVNVEESIGNVVFNVSRRLGNSTKLLAIDLHSNKILSNSNEFLSLIKVYYLTKKMGIYYESIFNDMNYLLDCYNKNLVDTTYRDKNVIPFITSFSNGTTHGYAGIYYIISTYLLNYESLKNYDILIYNNSQTGILDIINHFISKGLIDKNKIIRIDQDVKYVFNKMKFLPNKWHLYNFSDKLRLDLISNHIFDSDFKYSSSKIAVIKTDSTQNNTSEGVFLMEDINNFVDKFGLHLINPSDHNEIKFANIIHHSNILFLSWGSCFLKNYFYISNKCEKVIVLIPNDYIYQYKNQLNLPKKYKNARFYYIVSKSESTNKISNDLLNEVKSCLED